MIAEVWWFGLQHLCVTVPGCPTHVVKVLTVVLRVNEPSARSWEPTEARKLEIAGCSAPAARCMQEAFCVWLALCSDLLISCVHQCLLSACHVKCML